MGRYVTGSSQPRRRIVTLFASDPAVPIPVWARTGKAQVLVTGCGGGASGAIGSASTGQGGGGSAFAVEHPIIIPSGLSTCGVLIGAGGAAVTAAVETPGNIGGATVLTLGATILRLTGGGNGNAARWFDGGLPYVGPVAPTYGTTPPGLAYLGDSSQTGSGIGGSASRLSTGSTGGSSIQTGGYGAGGATPWGMAPLRTAQPAVGVNAEATYGYGAGGHGVRTNGPNVTSGEGRPGFLTLEFVEGF